jgi:hypothetical protein
LTISWINGTSTSFVFTGVRTPTAKKVAKAQCSSLPSPNIYDYRAEVWKAKVVSDTTGSTKVHERFSMLACETVTSHAEAFILAPGQQVKL